MHPRGAGVADRIAHLYVLGAVGGPCKIGWSEDAKKRSRGVPSPAGLCDVAHTAPVAYKNALKAERYAHWLLRDHHFRNEWFNVGVDAAIDAVNRAVDLNFRGVGKIPPLPEKNNMTRFPSGMTDLIDAVLEPGENRRAFLLEAIERELKRRKRAKG